MGHPTKDFPTMVFEILAIGLPDFSQEETFETGETLAIVETHLGDKPEGFASTASAAKSDGSGTVGEIAEAGGGAGLKLARLGQHAGTDEPAGLILGAPGGAGGAGERFSNGH
jgi:hypothetical protein